MYSLSSIILNPDVGEIEHAMIWMTVPWQTRHESESRVAQKTIVDHRIKLNK